MAEIKKGIGDFVSGFHINELANHLQYLIKEYYEGQIVAHTEARPDLGVDWWTAEYLADHIEEIANKLLEECDNLRAYANSGERRPLEDWQNAFNKSTKKSKMEKSSAVESMMDELLELAYDYDSQWVDTIMNAQYEYSYGSYQDVKADINEVLQKSDVGKIIGLCEDILQEMDALGKTKKSVSKPKDNTMSFEDNVNKMRTHNYARTGNINTVMKKRE